SPGGMSGANVGRRKELARIHCLKRDLRLGDSIYRDVLWTIARVESASDLDSHGRRAVIGQLSSRLPRGQRRAGATGYPGEPRTLRKRPLMQKIEAQLADSGRPWSYAEALAKRIAHKERLVFCSDAELGKIVAALAIDQKRHGASRPRARNETRSPKQIEISDRRRVADLRRKGEIVFWSSMRRLWIWEPRDRHARERTS